MASFVEDSDEKQFFFSFPLKIFDLYFDFYGAEKKNRFFFETTDSILLPFSINFGDYQKKKKMINCMVKREIKITQYQ